MKRITYGYIYILYNIIILVFFFQIFPLVIFLLLFVTNLVAVEVVCPDQCVCSPVEMNCSGGNMTNVLSSAFTYNQYSEQVNFQIFFISFSSTRLLTRVQIIILRLEAFDTRKLSDNKNYTLCKHEFTLSKRYRINNNTYRTRLW